MVAYLLELSVLPIAGYDLLRSYKVINRHVILITIMCMGFSSMFFASEAEVSTEVASISSLTLYIIIAFLAYWSEREINQ